MSLNATPRAASLALLKACEPQDCKTFLVAINDYFVLPCRKLCLKCSVSQGLYLQRSLGGLGCLNHHAGMWQMPAAALRARSKGYENGFLLLCCQILISNILAKQKPLKKPVNAVFKSHGSVCNVCINSSVDISIANTVKYLENSVLQWIDIFHIKTNRNPKADLIKSKKLILQNFHLLFFFLFAFTCRNWVSSNFASISEISCLPKPALSNHSLLPLG